MLEPGNILTEGVGMAWYFNLGGDLSKFHIAKAGGGSVRVSLVGHSLI
ncbi:MAG: hypothetical protein ABIQ30_11625 [Devosia sp.]